MGEWALDKAVQLYTQDSQVQAYVYDFVSHRYS